MSRNIVNDYILYDKDCIRRYLETIVKDSFDDELIGVIVETYVDVRYYDLYDQIDESLSKTLDYYVESNVLKYLKNSEKKISDSKIKKSIGLSLWLIKYLLYFEKATTDRKLTKLLENLEIELRKKFDNVDETIKDELFTLIKNNVNSKKKFVRKLRSNDFHLELLDTNNLLVYNVNLISDVEVPDLFSEIAINRVYNSGIIKEDKQLVLLTLVSSLVLENILEYNYKTNYIVEFDCSLLSKRNKINNLLKIVDLDLLKDKISFRIKYSEFINNKDAFYEYIKKGYKFAIILDESFDGNNQLLDIFSYIIVNESAVNDYLTSKENIIIQNK